MNKFAICISAEEDSLLTPRRIYRILPDEKADHSDYVRVIDDEGEDYLYPKKILSLCPSRKKLKKYYFKPFKVEHYRRSTKCSKIRF